MVLVGVLASGCYARLQALPDGISFAGPAHPTTDVEFLADLTWVDESGVRSVSQEIFDAVFDVIGAAERAIVVDMFLFNDFQGDAPETTRALSGELTDTLIARKRERPGIDIIVISDPVNTVYGGIDSKHFDALRDAGIDVVVTDLTALRDSNPLYSALWRLTFGWLGNSKRPGVMPSPFGDDRVTLRSYLALLNFKANHRKVVIADDGADGVVGLVTSANPHDGSSAHGNVALRFRGAVVADLWETERAVVEFSRGDSPALVFDAAEVGVERESEATVQVVTEGKIYAAVLQMLASAGAGDDIDVAAFYLSNLEVVDALVAAQARGAHVRVLLDPNKDAFGYEKSGIPNRPVGSVLHRRGVHVRWCDTHGEQCHAKMIIVRRASGDAELLLGSANFTRRNLEDYNLETSVIVAGDLDTPAIRDASEYFQLVWANEPGRRFSVGYEVFADDSAFKRFRYWVAERTGFGTF